MFKNILLVLLLISTSVFAYIAVRNSTPLECSEVVYLESNSICLIDMDGLTANELEQAIKNIRLEQYKYVND